MDLILKLFCLTAFMTPGKAATKETVKDRPIQPPSLSETLVYLAHNLGYDSTQRPHQLLCKIGDKRYSKLIRMLDEREQTWYGDLDEDHARYIKAMKEVNMPQDRKTRMMDVAAARYDLVKTIGNLDYPDSFSKQKNTLAEMETREKPAVSFIGLPAVIHVLHQFSYEPIKNLLMSSPRPMAIVRMDSHSDCVAGGKMEETLGNNYLTQLLFDEECKKKIAVVMSMNSKVCELREFPRNTEKESGLPPDICRCYNINGVSFYSFRIFDMPTIQCPSIIDIDLDGHENAPGQGAVGGYVIHSKDDYKWNQYVRQKLIEKNRETMEIDPTASAMLLRRRIRNPKLISIATERSYRNNIFWFKLERDFLNALVADPSEI